MSEAARASVPLDWSSTVEPVWEGIFRIPVPVPIGPIPATNVYALVDQDGVTLVDGGWSRSESQALLEETLSGLGLALVNVRTVLVTHLHRDHYTLATWLRRMVGTSVGLGIGEREALSASIDGQATAEEQVVPVLIRAGAAPLVALMRQLQDTHVPRNSDFEVPDFWIKHGDSFPVGPWTLRAISTPGHTRGHLCFALDEAGLLFSGDHVLPHLTPSIGLQPGRERLVLRRYLDSLRALLERPDGVLLPAHGPVHPSVHERVNQLLEHHEIRLRACEEVVLRDGSATAFEVAGRLQWTRQHLTLDQLDPMARVHAVQETLAHLDVLADDGRIICEERDDISQFEDRADWRRRH